MIRVLKQNPLTTLTAAAALIAAPSLLNARAGTSSPLGQGEACAGSCKPWPQWVCPTATGLIENFCAADECT